MRELTLYRMWRFFEYEFKCLELFKDLDAGINPETALLMTRIPINAGRLILSTRYPEEFGIALSKRRLVSKSEDKILWEWMQQDRTSLQELSQAKPRPVATDEIQSGILRASGSLFEWRSES